MRLILVRHGQTDWNRERRVQGLSDLALNEIGRRQAEALAHALRNETIDAIYTSPLRRARETADAIGRFHDVPVIVHDGLKELDVGQVDGLTYEEMKAQHSEFFARWMADFTSVRLPGGGTLPELQEQCCTALDEIVTEHRALECSDKDQKRVVLITHYFPILSVLCRSLGLELSQSRRIRLDVASICVLDFNSSRPVLVSLNDTCHLRELSQ